MKFIKYCYYSISEAYRRSESDEGYFIRGGITLSAGVAFNLITIAYVVAMLCDFHMPYEVPIYIALATIGFTVMLCTKKRYQSIAKEQNRKSTKLGVIFVVSHLVLSFLLLFVTMGIYYTHHRFE